MFAQIVLKLKPDPDKETNNIAERIKRWGAENGVPTSRFLPQDYLTSVLFVSIGGDGTMLGAMREMLNYPLATIMGINTGSLGFLSDELPDDLEKQLENIYSKIGVELDNRMVVTGEVFRNGKNTKLSFSAINEFIISGKSLSDPVITRVFINDRFVSEHLGNGVLVSTSTGSTAMSLSAGGSIVSPSTNIMQIVPLIPHTLTTRPIISTGRDSITIKTELTNRIRGIEIQGDGITLASYEYNGKSESIELEIGKHGKNIAIWRKAGWNFFDVLSKKMKW